jgi:hypothetical protein
MRSNTEGNVPCLVSESCTAEHYFTLQQIMTQKEFMASTVIAFFHNVIHCELLMRFLVKRNSNDPHLFFRSTFTSSSQLLDVICVKITFLRERGSVSIVGYGIDDLGSIPGRGNDLSSPSSRDRLRG